MNRSSLPEIRAASSLRDLGPTRRNPTLINIQSLNAPPLADNHGRARRRLRRDSGSARRVNYSHTMCRNALGRVCPLYTATQPSYMALLPSKSS